MKDIKFEVRKILWKSMVKSDVAPNCVLLTKSEDEIVEEIVKLCNLPQVSGCDGLIEEKIFKLKFPNDEFNIDDYNDWASENGREAYQLCLKIIKSSHCR